MLNPKGVRVIDPILSSVALGYKQPDHVGHTLFPRVDVQVSGGQVLEFGREGFRLYRARRAPGAATKRIEFGYAGKPFALVQDSLEGKVPREHLRDASQVPGIDLGTRTTRIVMASLSLALEDEQARLARNAANYDNDHKVDLAATPWTDDDNNPSVDIATGREAIREGVGIDPNTVLLSAKAFRAAVNNLKIVERFKFTGRDAITPEMLATIWDIPRVVVGRCVVFDGEAVTDVWGPDAVLAYAPMAPSGQEEPSYGYTYTMTGNPAVETAYYDNNAKSWIYPVTYERAPVLSGMLSGYLLQNAAG